LEDGLAYAIKAQARMEDEFQRLSTARRSNAETIAVSEARLSTLIKQQLPLMSSGGPIRVPYTDEKGTPLVREWSVMNRSFLKRESHYLLPFLSASAKTVTAHFVSLFSMLNLRLKHKAHLQRLARGDALLGVGEVKTTTAAAAVSEKEPEEVKDVKPFDPSHDPVTVMLKAFRAKSYANNPRRCQRECTIAFFSRFTSCVPEFEHVAWMLDYTGFLGGRVLSTATPTAPADGICCCGAYTPPGEARCRDKDGCNGYNPLSFGRYARRSIAEFDPALALDGPEDPSVQLNDCEMLRDRIFDDMTKETRAKAPTVEGGSDDDDDLEDRETRASAATIKRKRRSHKDKDDDDDNDDDDKDDEYVPDEDDES